MYKKIIFILVFGLVTITSKSQECPSPIKEKYVKVMSSAFAKEFEDCPVIIEGVYFQQGYLKNYRKPRKLKKMFFFQCVKEGGEGKTQAFQSGLTGDFFVIDKKYVDKVIDLEKGDKLELTGTTFTQNYFGNEMSTFFIVTDLKKK